MENMENAARKKVMLSGIQPSGDLTLGSYLGAIKNWAERDEEFDNYYFMADMHSITVRQDPAALRRRTLEQLAVHRLRLGPREEHAVHPVPRAAARRARLGPELLYDVRRALAHDAV